MKLAWIQRELAGLVLVAIAIAFQAFALAPEWTYGRLPPNDAVFHLAASERLGASLGETSADDPFLDPWVFEWALGYPVWRSYQPIPHLLAAAVLRVFDGTPADLVFARLQYTLLVLLPASLFAGARLLGLHPTAAGLAALLALLPATGGEMGRYGIAYGATVWRGSGLYTQLVALHFLAPTLGLVARALDRGRGRTRAAIALALTSLSHVVFGFVGFLSAALFALVGPGGDRARRIARLPALAITSVLLLSWFVVPLILTHEDTHGSRWESRYKWDSFGAPAILADLTSGAFFDRDRAPILTALVLLGAGAAVAAGGVVSGRLAALAFLWLLLFFGRATWGHLLVLLGIPAELHLHRLQVAFEVAALLLAGHGIAEAVARARRRLRAVAIAGVALAMVSLLRERSTFLAENGAWAEANFAEYQRQRPDLEAAMNEVAAILAERPGRVSAGKAASWGKDFKVGSVPVYAFLTRARMDEVSFLYHSMSRTADVMVLRDESRRDHDVAMGIRAVIAPTNLVMPGHLRVRARHGAFAVYESSPEGYFGLVDIIAATDDRDRAHEYELGEAWLASSLVSTGSVVSLQPGTPPGLPVARAFEPLPAAADDALRPRGWVLGETLRGSTLSARIRAERVTFALVKMTWHPDLRAEVDGVPTALVRVTPGFGAVAITPGDHEVVVRFDPGPMKPLLLVVAVLIVAIAASPPVGARLAAAEARAATFGANAAKAWLTPRRRAALAVLVLALLALRPLYRGQLIDGHDAMEYPPRLVEFEQLLRAFELPPVWAPDLGNGHGQPLFAFAPPLVYVAALPFRLLRMGLADALQLGLLGLHLLGAGAIYRLARRLDGSRPVATATAALWLFAPYVALDLFVRTAYAEAAAVAAAAMALDAIVALALLPSRRRLALAAGLTALVPLAHNAAALLVLPTLVVAAIAAAARNRRAIAHCALAIGLGLGLSCYFWAPALVEKSLVKVDLLREGFLHWSEHIVAPQQLLWSRWGFGLSLPGRDDGMSFAIGLPLLLLAGAGLVMLARERGTESRRAVPLLVVLAAIAVVGAFLAVSWSAFLWQRLGMLQYLAYPWRALMLPALSLPIVALPALASLERRRWLVPTVATVMILGLPRTEPKGYRDFDDADFAATKIAEHGVNTTTREEYEPRTVTSRPPFMPEPLRAITGQIAILSHQRRGSHERLQVRAREASEVETRTFFYPGFVVTVDGAPQVVTTVPITGVMRFSLSQGDHDVEIRLAPTPIRTASTWVSVAAALATIILAAIPRSPPRSAPPGGAR